MFVRRKYSDSEMIAAVKRRDPFFDHLFYQGILTTAVYCRTSCSAKLPLPKNVRFIFSKEEATNAGFRPCKRCRPDIASSFESIAIPVRKSLNYHSAFDFLTMRAVAGIEDVSAEHYARSLEIGGFPVVVSVHYATQHHGLIVRYWGAVNSSLVKETITRLFDLNAPTTQIRRHLKLDSILGDTVAKNPPQLLPVYIDPFEGSVRAIVGQLISVKAARTKVGRFIQAFGERLPQEANGISHLFPTVESLSGLHTEDLKTLGLTSGKSSAILSVAMAIRAGDLDFTQLAKVDSKSADLALQKLPGVGPWTSSIIRMEALHDTNAFPAGDLGVVKATTDLTKKTKISKDQLAKLHQSWSPWGAYATLYLWKHLESMEAEKLRKKYSST